MPRKSGIQNENLGRKDLSELNSFIRRASKILNDRQRYFEELSGRRGSKTKKVASRGVIRDLELEEALYIMSSKAMEINSVSGAKKISSGGSVRFSSAPSKTMKSALERALKMKSLLRSPVSTVSGRKKEYEARREGLSQEIFGMDGRKLSASEYREINDFFDLAEKYNIPSDIVFRYVILQRFDNKKDAPFRSSAEFEKWLEEWRQKSSPLRVEYDLINWSNFRSTVNRTDAATIHEQGFKKTFDSVLNRFWNEME